MLSTYCQHCGGKNEYTVTKPKFCSSCGQPLAAHLSDIKGVTPLKSTSSRARPIQAEVHDEDGTDIYEVPDISNLEYEIEVSNSSFTLGSIMPREPALENVVPPKRKRGRPKKNG